MAEHRIAILNRIAVADAGIDVEYVKPLHVSIEERVAAAVAAAKE